MATNNDDVLDHWLDVLPADTRAAILDSVEDEDEDVDESPQIVHTPPAPDEEPEPEPEPEPDPTQRTRSAELRGDEWPSSRLRSSCPSPAARDVAGWFGHEDVSRWPGQGFRAPVPWRGET